MNIFKVDRQVDWQSCGQGGLELGSPLTIVHQMQQ